MAQLIGEIVEVNTTGFTAQCYESHEGGASSFVDPPPFGSFVKITGAESGAQTDVEGGAEIDPFASRPPLTELSMASKDIFAIVCHASTGSIAPGRRPRALGMSSEEQMRSEYPQVFELLTTSFNGMLIAYTDRHGKYRRYLPPTPPRIHASVVECDPAELVDLTENLSFLRFILAMGQGMGGASVPADSLVAACIRHALIARGNDIEFLENAGRTLLPLLGDDYQRLQGIIESAGAL